MLEIISALYLSRLRLHISLYPMYRDVLRWQIPSYLVDLSVVAHKPSPSTQDFLDIAESHFKNHPCKANKFSFIGETSLIGSEHIIVKVEN